MEHSFLVKVTRSTNLLIAMENMLNQTKKWNLFLKSDNTKVSSFKFPMRIWQNCGHRVSTLILIKGIILKSHNLRSSPY